MKLVRTAQLRKRGKSYYAEYTDHKGRRPRPTLGSDYATATKLLVKINEWLYEGKDPIEELKRFREEGGHETLTLRLFFPTFMQQHGKFQSKSMQNLYTYCWHNIRRCKEIADIPMVNINKGLVMAYMRARVDEGAANATANREAAMIRNMLNRAVDWNCIPYTQVHGLKLLKEKQKREVNVTPEQIAELIDMLSDPIADIIEFAVYTGFRKENILSLKIENVSLENPPKVRLKVKGGKLISFPIASQAADVLRRVIGDRLSGYVFVNPNTRTRYHSIHKQFNTLVQKLNLTVDGTKLRFHDLRHVFATWLINAGVSPIFVQTLLGHTDIKTTDRYITASMNEAGKALENLPEIRRHNGDD